MSRKYVRKSGAPPLQQWSLKNVRKTPKRLKQRDSGLKEEGNKSLVFLKLTRTYVLSVAETIIFKKERRLDWMFEVLKMEI
jgi:hypothetical protein